jgi:hypothetical protein
MFPAEVTLDTPLGREEDRRRLRGIGPEGGES